MTRLLAVALAAFLAWALAVAVSGRQEEPFEPTDFLRFEKKGKGEGQLQTANVTYEGPAGEKVTLIAAVHVGDREYYRHLQKVFSLYDALLYELVAAEGHVPEKGEVNASPISLFQRGMKNVLGLEFQLDAIDYKQKNFVHADLDPETFHRLQRERGESLIGLLLKAAMAEWRRQASGNGSSFGIGHLVLAFASDDSARVLKYFLAQELEDVEKLLAGIEDDDKGSVIVTERNKKAIEVLRREIGKGKKKLAIFYGAAHMGDLEERLMRELGFKKKKIAWVTAWDVRRKDASKKKAPEKEAAERPAKGD